MAAPDHVYDHETGSWAALVSRSHGHPTFTDEYFANQVNLAVITPPAGRRISVCGVHTGTAANAGVISLDFAVSLIPVWRLYASRFQHIAATGMHIEGAVGEALTLNTTTGGNAAFLLVNYRIIDA